MPLRPSLAASVLALAAVILSGDAARAQASDSERAAARELFKQGDELQRAGRFADALDRFRRAEQVVHAPTNVLRIAECQAATGRLVEAAESYRSVVRWSLPAGSPAAFQSAVDQARGELAQIEPRVPKVVVRVTPPGTADVELVVDGAKVSGALVGEPIPLDPGDHKIGARAPGFEAPEEPLALRERETRNVEIALRPSAAAAPSPGTDATAPAPVPPAYEPSPEGERHPRHEVGLLMGGHLGLGLAAGTIPVAASQSASAGDLSGPGLAVGLDGGLRFLRQFYLGLTLEHMAFSTGKSPSTLGSSGTSDLTSSTTALGLVGAIIVNPDRPSLFAEVGLGSRWYQFSTTLTGNQSFLGPDLMAGLGVWLPVNRWLRVLPLATASLGSFSPPNETSGSTQGQQGHAFFMLGVEGLYNLDF